MTKQWLHSNPHTREAIFERGHIYGIEQNIQKAKAKALMDCLAPEIPEEHSLYNQLYEMTLEILKI